MADLVTFVITDGTTVVDLLDVNHGNFKTARFMPQSPDYKNGGTYRESPFVDGRRLIGKAFANPIDTVLFTGAGSNMDAYAAAMQDFRRLLEQAAAYFTTEWQTSPVWCEVKARYETNIRYAVVVRGLIKQDPDLFTPPFSLPLDVVAPSMLLTFEHFIWQSTQPGTSTAVLASANEAFNGVTFGNVTSAQVRQPTASAEVYVANQKKLANLTHIFRASSAGVFGANMIGAALPYDIFSDRVLVSATYFGISTAVADNGPFNSLVFDIGSTIIGGTLVWEYWSGAAWAALTIQDNTAGSGNSFSRLGVNSINFAQPTNWATTAVNAVTAWWVRVRASATISLGGIPTQQNRNPYTVSWPYTEIQSTEIGGDITALAEMIVRNRSNVAGLAPDVNVTLGADRFILGLRSTDRGLNFTPYLNANGQNHASIAAAINATFVTSVAEPSGPTGAISLFTAAAGTLTNILFESWTISAPLAQEYLGRFRAFARVTQTAGPLLSTSLGLTAQVGSSGPVVPANATYTTIPSLGAYQLVDLGSISLGLQDLTLTDQMSTIKLSLMITTALTVVVRLYDIILIPADEWIGDFDNANGAVNSPTNASTIAVYTVAVPPNENPYIYLDVDSVRNFKRTIRAYSYRTSGTQGITGYYEPRTAQPLMLQSNERQRLHFLCARNRGATTANWVSADPAIMNTPTLVKTQRYLGMRGNR